MTLEGLTPTERLALATRCLPTRPSPNQVVTVVVWRFAVVDLVYRDKLDKWVLLRVLKNSVP